MRDPVGTTPSELADWLEVNAIVSKDQNSSVSEVVHLLQKAGQIMPGESSAVQSNIVQELLLRQRAGGQGYPFLLTGLKLEALPSTPGFVPYLYSLVLSHVGQGDKKASGVRARLFEESCKEAARHFVGGEAWRFGFPRTGTKKFRPALEELVKLLGEGYGVLPGSTLDAKDDALDVVAWRHFPDRQAGKLLLFGQAATGKNWSTKLDELQPGAFCQQWITGSLPSPIVKAIFVPYVLRTTEEEWRYWTTRAGLVFDRPRLSYWACQTTTPSVWAEHRKEINEMLKLA